ncbi:MAG: hypothetical protein HWE35_08245 [Rhodobacteraceae bacterium]|nr:hypothetical protein [Paracoccaceae bacterium]
MNACLQKVRRRRQFPGRINRLQDFKREDRLTLQQPYDGDAALTVITANDPNSDHLILWGGQFHKILEVLGADALRGTVRYRVKALPKDEAVPVWYDMIL